MHVIPATPAEALRAATRDQLDAIAREYADLMRALGHEVPEANIPVLRRAAAIQDAWRVAFARVLDSANDTEAKP